MNTLIYDIPLKTIAGNHTTLAEHKGKVALIVNVASKCGLTPQYAGLEKLHEKYKHQGFAVLGFPSNDFAGQEPGSASDIQTFCTMNFGVTFPMYEKIAVNSDPRHPLYAALIAAQPKAVAADEKFRKALALHKLLPKSDADVTWNFEKFLVGRDGSVIGRFAPDIVPDHPVLIRAIEAALPA